MITNPPKKGTGYGYCDVTLGKTTVHGSRTNLIIQKNIIHMQMSHIIAVDSWSMKQTLHITEKLREKHLNWTITQARFHSLQPVAWLQLSPVAINWNIMKTEISWLFWQKSVPTSKYQKQTAGRRRTKKPAKDQTVSDNFTFKSLLPKLSKGLEFKHYLSVIVHPQSPEFMDWNQKTL